MPYILYYEQSDRKRHPVIIVKFVHRYLRNEIFTWEQEGNLQGSGVYFSEHLTHSNRKLFQAAKDRFHDNAWTNQCRIYVLQNGRKKELLDECDRMQPPVMNATASEPHSNEIPCPSSSSNDAQVPVSYAKGISLPPSYRPTGKQNSRSGSRRYRHPHKKGNSSRNTPRQKYPSQVFHRKNYFPHQSSNPPQYGTTRHVEALHSMTNHAGTGWNNDTVSTHYNHNPSNNIQNNLSNRNISIPQNYSGQQHLPGHRMNGNWNNHGNNIYSNNNFSVRGTSFNNPRFPNAHMEHIGSVSY